ncbi:DUF748 domain-containing protein [Solimonas marina]|uniref:DUF748 domain-containing protein n=1 Tax=Solimonas marina TaxID=2714601 RepID=A0A969WEJ0_9GAMM|nr:DUF748 domain-containing protein [Solimonas marina]NKF24670.1 DUF748 domain-containing protein [Solimonas marina]
MQRRRRWPWIVLVLVGALVLLRVLLPGWATGYLNRHLDQMGSYHGHLRDVDLHLWRGGYTIHDLIIVKRDGAVPVPLLKAPRIELSISWPALMLGGIVGEVEFWRPELNIVDGKSERDTQTGRGVDWRQRLESLLAIRLNEVDVHDGTLHFRNYHSQPAVDLVATQVNGAVYNLTNVEDKNTPRAATMSLQARLFGEAPLEARAAFNPFGGFGDFKLDARARDVDLRRLNDFLQAYIKLDAESGSGDIVVQLDAHDGRLEGYAKPLFRDVSIFSWKHDIEEQHDNPLRAAWEALAGGLQNLLKNQRKDQFATRVVFSGRIDQPQTSALQAIVAILRNGFIKAYQPHFEDLPVRRAPAPSQKRGDDKGAS